jgi:hypothetical protein
MVCHEPVGNVNSCRRMSTADILSKSIPVDISFGLAAMPGSETRFSNAASSMNLKLIVNCENPHEDSHSSRPGRRAVRVSKCCEHRELFDELKLGNGVWTTRHFFCQLTDDDFSFTIALVRVSTTF